ncbi:MAG: DAK2 domain-containing protein, partial [Clostridiales bacterium]|nr:DAK2 domain-containing protein [Clostridiales bacterium]
MADFSLLDANTLREMVNAGAALLEKNREAVNALNVFPVPDGDTGTNMSMTMLSAVKEINNKDTTAVGELAEALSKGALRGARGNSGVILSQLYRGFSKALADRERISPADFAAALRAGADTAYKAVMKPKEGTILTVARVIADDAVKQAQMEPDSFSALMRVILTSGESILKRTQEMLPALTQAGVVDAGGRGLLLIYTGYAAVINGEQLDDLVVDMSGDSAEDKSFIDDHEALEDITFAYCTEFFIQQLEPGTTDADVASLRRKLSRIGDSMVVVSDSDLIKVHLHTNDPGKALQYALMLGELNGLKIDNMVQQRRDLDAQKPKDLKDYGIVAVSQGDGFDDIFKDLGVDAIVRGGQTMNPSIDDLKKAVDSVNAKCIFILPNNGNITLAAQQVAEMTEGKVIVLPTKNVAMGIAAVVAFQPEESPEENAKRMDEAAQKVRTGMITYAVRDTNLDDLKIKEGSIIGLNNGQVTVNCDTAEEAAVLLMKEIVSEDDGLITVYYGDKTDEKDAQALRDQLEELYPDCDV